MPLDHQQEFTVHLDIITKRSLFFREFTRDKDEKFLQSQKVVLSHYTPETFDQYLHCLYHNKVPEYIQPLPTDQEAIPSPEQEEANRKQHVDSKFKSLVTLYNLARRLSDPVTENMVIDEIKRHGQDDYHQKDRTPGPEVIELAFRLTGPDSYLRDLLVDLYLFNKNATYKGDYPEAFLDLVVRKFLHWKFEKCQLYFRQSSDSRPRPTQQPMDECRVSPEG